MAKFVGGPWDGRELEATSFRVVVPGTESVEAKWYEEDEPMPMELDPLTGVPRMKLPTISTHVYQRGKDGQYYYQGPSGSLTIP